MYSNSIGVAYNGKATSLAIWKTRSGIYMTRPLALFSLLLYSELNLPPTSNGRYDPQTVQQFLDSLVEEIHISDDEFNVDYSFPDDENKEQLDVSTKIDTDSCINISQYTDPLDITDM